MAEIIPLLAADEIDIDSAEINEINELAITAVGGSSNQLSTDKKDVSVQRCERYTRIYINQKVNSEIHGSQTKTYLQTCIVKDKWLKSTETYIKKVFTTKNDQKDTTDVIMREIFIDRERNAKHKDARSIRVSVNNTDELESQISHLLNSDQPLMLAQ